MLFYLSVVYANSINLKLENTMIKQSLIAIATLGLMTISASSEANLAGCTGCHGKDFEKKAMNVSKIVKDMSNADIVTALKGYQEDKGGAMKAIMKGQVAKLSDADIAEIATAIAGGEKKEEAKGEDNATKAEDNATKTEDNTTKADATPAKEVDTASCVGCHGKDFEKAALGKSKIVKDMTKAEIEASLKGYKDGSYGGAMKAVMKPNADKLSDEDIKAISEKFGK